ncbi:hypothetical protein ACMFMF_000616 [Clarireedia jacksonii]
MGFTLKRLSLLTPLLPALYAVGAHALEPDYDIIVVGAGAGGIVAATKFAESGLKTLLLERGGPMLYRDGNREIPQWSLEEYPGNNLTRHDSMAYYTSNYPGSPNATSYYCSDLPNVLAACMLGGGTSVNAEQQFWPPRHYLDATFGFQGWTSDDFQPAIERVAARIPPTPYWSSDNKFYHDEVYHIMGDVLKGIGMKEVDTIANGDAKYNTFGRDVYAAKDGLRGGPLVGYLPDAKKLSSFTLKMYSTVESLERTGNTITGVKVNGTTITSKTVVLSAGVWNTPALLFASGIGPESVLRTALASNYTSYAEEDWIINDGVGMNLHDNPQANLMLTYNDTNALPFFSLSGALTGVNMNKADKDNLFYHSAGPLTGTGRQLSAWITVNDTDSTTQMTAQAICSTPTAVNGTFACQFNLNEGLLSRGSIVLNSTGYLQYGAGVGPWLTNPLDVKLFALALQRFMNATALYPGLNVTTLPVGDLASYEAFLKAHASVSNNHWGGSCTIGTSNGNEGGKHCTDINAKVYGTANLYVIDGSLSPAPTTSNPSFLYETLAEMATDKIIPLLK